MLKIDAESDQYVSVIRGFLVMFYDAQLIKIQHLNILYRRLSLVMDNNNNNNNNNKRQFYTVHA